MLETLDRLVDYYSRGPCVTLHIHIISRDVNHGSPRYISCASIVQYCTFLAALNKAIIRQQPETRNNGFHT
jgi:hypothetical protein